MFKHYIANALRNFWRSKSTTAVTIVGLALGLACFVAALGAVTFLTSGDRHFAESERIFVVTESMHPRGQQSMDFASLRSSMPLAQHLRADYPQLTVATARDVQEIPVAANERLGHLQAAAVDQEFLKIFDLPFIIRSATNPLSVPGGAIVTEETARRLFGSTQILGRTITLQNAFDVTVTGVIRSLPQPSHMGSTPTHILRFDILFTEDTYWRFQRARTPTLPAVSPLSGDSWGAPVCFTYVQFPKDGSFAARMLDDQLDALTQRHTATSSNRSMGFRHTLVPLASLPLAALDVELFRGNGLSLAALIFVLAFVVLAIACVNYANLSVAQALTRERELGLRRVLGATRWQIATQQWVESGIQVLIALALGCVLVSIGAVWFDAIVALERIVASVQFWLTLAGVCIGTVLVLGAYTALALVRADPVRLLRRSKTLSAMGIAPRVWVGVQFAAASALLIGLIVVARQNSVVRALALQPSTDPVVVLQFPGRETSVKFDTLKARLLSSPAIKNVSAITRTPWSTKQSSISSFSAQPGGTLHNTLIDFVHYDFEQAFDVTVLAGRSFDSTLNDRAWVPRTAQPGESFPIVVDRATAQQMGWTNPTDAVNGTLYWPSFSGGQVPLRVIGVIENNPLRLDAGPGAHSHIYSLLPDSASNVIVRIDKSRVAEALSAVDAVWEDFVPYAPVNRRFLDELFEREYQTLDLTNKVISALTIAGTSIALMGLFGMATFIAQRRRREIGVRKTLGASTRQVITLLLRDFSMPVLIANLLIWPLAFLAAQKYLVLFIQRIELTLWPFAASLSVTLLLAWIAVGGQAWRAACVQPAEVLRHE